MNVLIVDTSSWISFLKGRPSSILESGLKEGRVYLAAAVISELLSSFRPESKREQFVKFLRELPLCDCSFEHWVRVGNLRTLLAGKGFAISTPDAHIAQCAIDMEGYLLTEDKIFNKISKLAKLKLA